MVREFAGKYLTSAVLALRLTGDPVLRSYLEYFVKNLISTQDEQGYLGPYSRKNRFSVTDVWTFGVIIIVC